MEDQRRNGLNAQDVLNKACVEGYGRTQRERRFRLACFGHFAKYGTPFSHRLGNPEGIDEATCTALALVGIERLLKCNDADEAEAVIMGYRAALKNAGYSPTVEAGRYGALRAAILAAQALRLISWGPPNYRKQTGRPDVRVPSEVVCQKLLRTAHEQKNWAAEVVGRLLHDRGVSGCESLALRVEDIDLKAGKVWLPRCCPTGGERQDLRDRCQLSLPGELQDALEAYVGNRTTGPLFPRRRTPDKGHPFRSIHFLSYLLNPLSKSADLDPLPTPEGLYWRGFVEVAKETRNLFAIAAWARMESLDRVRRKCEVYAPELELQDEAAPLTGTKPQTEAQQAQKPPLVLEAESWIEGGRIARLLALDKTEYGRLRVKLQRFRETHPEKLDWQKLRDPRSGKPYFTYRVGAILAILQSFGRPFDVTRV